MFAAEQSAGLTHIVDASKTFAETQKLSFVETQDAAAAKVANLRQEMSDWAEGFQKQMTTAFQHGDIGTLGGGGRSGRESGAAVPRRHAWSS